MDIRSSRGSSQPFPAGTLTMLLTDVEGSTKQWAERPDAMRVAMERHHGIAREAIARHDGYQPPDQGEGDSVFAVFARASDAVALALDLQRRLGAERWPGGVELRVRVAVHTGELELRDDGRNYFGEAISRCARLRDTGHGGQVLLSEATHSLVGAALPPGQALKDLGVHRFKDLSPPGRVFQLTHPDLPADFPPLRSLDARTLRYRIEKHGLAPGPSRPAVHPTGAPAPASASAASPAGAGPGPGAVGERRHLTLLRALLVVPPAGSASEASRAFEAIVEKAQSFGGRVQELSPTGIEAVFGVEPVEDAPVRAAHAALAMQNAAEHARQSCAPHPPIKIALHAGQFSIDQVGGAAQIAPTEWRQAVTILEALLARGQPGTILVSGAATPFLERHFDLVSLGTDDAPDGARQLVGRELPAPGLRRRMARFVGRQHELELLESRLASAVTGRGQVVGIAGEAGIGKTRLLFEFRQRLADDRVTYLEGHCLAYGSAMPYLPLLDLVRSGCVITEADTPEAIGEKVGAALQAIGMDAEEAGPYLLQLLGVKDGTGPPALLSPEAIKARTFETLRQMSLRSSRQQPLVLAIENLHWIDRTSEEYFASLVESLAGAPILLLLTYRPGYRPPGMEKSYATQVALQALAASDSRSLVRSLPTTQELPEEVARLVLAKAEGNPFFLEELALTVVQHGEPHAGATVPNTIQETLMTRIDRLPDAAKRVLQTASILGREFSLRLLGALWAGPGGLDPHLVELRRLEFLYEQSGADEPAYVFKHALTLEVAYESLSAARRRSLHVAAGRTLETLYAERLAEVYERLAYHYARTDDSVKAVEYLIRAADKAAASYAHGEAVGALAEAARHAERLAAEAQDRPILDVALRQARSLYFLGRFPESLDLLLRQRERVERLRDSSLAASYHFWLGYTHSHLGDHAEADRNARRAIQEASRTGDQATVGRAYYLLARGGFWSGRFYEGVQHGRQAVHLLEPTEARWWLGAAHWAVAFNYGFMGEFATALEAATAAHAIGEAIGDPRLQTYAAWTTGWLRAGMGEWDEGIEACRLSLENSPDPVNTADAMSFLGYAHVGKGEAGAAIPLLTRANERWRQFEHRPMLGWFTAVLAEACLLEGQPERARDLATEALGFSGDAGFPYGVALAERILGRIARASGDLAEADAHLARGLETFAAIGARSQAAETRLDCARVACAQGDSATAARHLAEAVAAFGALGLPRLEARAAQVAAELGLPLPTP